MVKICKDLIIILNAINMIMKLMNDDLIIYNEEKHKLFIRILKRCKYPCFLIKENFNDVYDMIIEYIDFYEQLDENNWKNNIEIMRFDIIMIGNIIYQKLIDIHIKHINKLTDENLKEAIIYVIDYYIINRYNINKFLSETLKFKKLDIPLFKKKYLLPILINEINNKLCNIDLIIKYNLC